MRWEGNRESDNVEDHRGEGGGGGGFGFGGRSIGIGTIVVALIGGWVLGVNPMTILGLLSGGGPVQVSQQQQQRPRSEGNDREYKLMKVVLADTEDVWTDLFRRNGGTYQMPKMKVFSGAIQTACGAGRSATGPFYCPGDQDIYIDLDFFRLLEQRFHAPGEFAQAYVVAHEVGHHVQNLMGLSDKVHNAQRNASERQANALSVRLELQADCFAGVWAYHANRARSIIEKGDVEAALNAATAIGDDALQKQSGGEVMPDSFTHGSSAQRVRWFNRGIESGEIAQCNTFEARQL
ncbi:neutral zinc metallopeptidase [Duganella sp. Root336D2]|uniref:KPN_02809 family neutral zinc metallopeptidase n=1 Tax=Duganella sp. Root336D2 TaxID=1736518 RepID=UPI0006F72B43|nr:neutral zinc metallopeptidase [Duganella sp. Root336D2]KQV61749.1 metalloprotease [Duganella sp. Root336D2]